VSFYSGRSVLVVGGLGFIGVNLVTRLIDLHARVVVVTPCRARHPVRALEYEARGVRVMEADVRDRAAMRVAVARHDVLFNLAGESGAIRSMEDPWTNLDVNCGGSLALLEALRTRNPGAKLVFVGSRLEYGRPTQLPVREEDVNEPVCIHAIHKLAVEQYLRLYQRLYGVRHSIARVTNPFGPGQPAGRSAYGVVNRMIHLALEDGVLTVYGDGSQQRDYIYVDDVVSALLRLGETSVSDGRAYNVGTGQPTRLVDMARLIVEIAGGGSIQHVEWPPLAEQIETGDFVADISRARREIQWSPAVTLTDGLRRMVECSRAAATPCRVAASQASQR
jgi:UDP-glucose 4-epimerase